MYTAMVYTAAKRTKSPCFTSMSVSGRENLGSRSMVGVYSNGLYHGVEDKVAMFYMDVGYRQGKLGVKVDGRCIQQWSIPRGRGQSRHVLHGRGLQAVRTWGQGRW